MKIKLKKIENWKEEVRGKSIPIISDTYSLNIFFGGLLFLVMVLIEMKMDVNSFSHKPSIVDHIRTNMTHRQHPRKNNHQKDHTFRQFIPPFSWF